MELMKVLCIDANPQVACEKHNLLREGVIYTVIHQGEGFCFAHSIEGHSVGHCYKLAEVNNVFYNCFPASHFIPIQDEEIFKVNHEELVNI